MFIEYKNKLVNTDAVTNITFDNKKIIFNLDYSITFRNRYKQDNDKLIPDYVYFEVEDDFDFAEIKSKIDELNWIQSTFENNNRIINPNAISSIKLESERNRIVFNLRCSITQKNDPTVTTSDYVYYHYDEVDGLFVDFDVIKKKLKGVD